MIELKCRGKTFIEELKICYIDLTLIYDKIIYNILNKIER